jgi:hypothetical protein
MDWKLNVFPTLKTELRTFFDARWIFHNNITYVLDRITIMQQVIPDLKDTATKVIDLLGQ